MKKKALAGLLSIFLLIGGGAALSLDSFIDTTACSASLAAPFMGAACTIATFDDIMSGGPEDVQNDIYVKTSFVKDARDRINTEQRSQLNQTYGMAMSDAKLEIIKALNNGSSQAEASQEGLKEVKDLYSSYEQRVLAQRNREALKINETIRKIESTSGLSMKDVFKVKRAVNDPITRIEFNWRAPQDIRVVEKNYTLYNGSVVDIFEVQPKFKWQDCYSDADCSDKTGYLNFSTQATYVTRGQDSNDASDTHPEYDTQNRDTVIRVYNVDGNHSKFVHGTPYVNTLDRINSRYQTASTTVTDLSNKVFSNYQAGDINVSSVCGPLCSLKQASTNYEDTGAYSYLAYSLYQMGLASDAATAFEIQWNESGTLKQQTGQLFLETEAWSDTKIETGKTYDASNKPAWFVYKPQGSKAVKNSLNGNFTVKELWNAKESKQINSTSVQKTEFYTESTEGLQSQLENVTRVNDITLDVEGLNGTGGGGSGFLDSLTPYQLGLGITLLVILFLGTFIAGVVMSW